MNNSYLDDTYCSYELSQMLLAKGADFRVNIDRFLGIKNNKCTHSEALKWLRLQQGLHIVAILSQSKHRQGKWHYHRFDLKNRDRDSEPELVPEFDTHDEAIEAGIRYTIEKIYMI